MSDSTPTPRPIRFVHQGKVQNVSDLPPTTTVLQWLREHAHCTGTKEGCAEGDCGACTVMVGSLDANGHLQKQTVNSCIQFLPTLDGKALITVEDLAEQELHPCQQAMVDCHGSQCGFCTPGFVMSLLSVYETHEQAPSRSELADALSGNLCRCTGYRPILEAGQKMFELPRTNLNFDRTVQALNAVIEADPSNDTFVYEGPNASIDATSPQKFVAPRTLDELAHWRALWPQARLIAGTTDVGLWVNKQFRNLGPLIYLGNVQALQSIEVIEDTITIGAGCNLEEAWQVICDSYPDLKEIWLRFASPPVRHAGTLGGNLANGSPIGDGAPVLLALNADLILRKGSQTRTLPLSSFYLDYMKNALEEGEFLQAIRIPRPNDQAKSQVRAYKISKRRDSDISSVCGAFYIRLSGDTIAEARLAYGGMAGTARRAAQAENALVGAPWTETTLRHAQTKLALDFQPLTDLRASDQYRSTIAANLLERFWLETRLQDPLPAQQVQVWPAIQGGAQP